MCYCDQELGIEYSWIAAFDINDVHRIHVMNVDSIVDIKTFDTKVASVITHDHMVTDITPFSGSIKGLVEVAIKPEGYITNLAVEREVFVSFLKRIQTANL